MPKTYPTAEQVLKDHTGRVESHAEPWSEITEALELPLPGLETEMLDLFNAIHGLLPQKTGKVLQFMSTEEGEGATTISRAFATVTALRLKQSVLFVDSLDPAEASLSSALYSPRMHELLQHLRRHYNLVVIDAPAATVSSDSFALARHVDGVILIAEADYTRWPVVQHLKDRLIKSGGTILGVVLNKRRYYIPSFLYKRF